MNLGRTIRLGLAAKLAISVTASTAAFFALFGFINLRAERVHSQDFVEQSADRVTDLILRSTRYEMLHNDREALYNIIRELGSQPGIQRIRIFKRMAASPSPPTPARSIPWSTRAPRPAMGAMRNRRRLPGSTAPTAPVCSGISRALTCWP